MESTSPQETVSVETNQQTLEGELHRAEANADAAMGAGQSDLAGDCLAVVGGLQALLLLKESEESDEA